MIDLFKRIFGTPKGELDVNVKVPHVVIIAATVVALAIIAGIVYLIVRFFA